MDAAGFDFVLRPRAPTGSLAAGPRLAGLIGSDRFALVLPDALVGAILAQAPEPVDWDALAPADAALALECLLGPVLQPLEARLGLPISLESVIPASGLTDDSPDLRDPDPWRGLFVRGFPDGREPRGRMAQDLLQIVALGPGDHARTVADRRPGGPRFGRHGRPGGGRHHCAGRREPPTVSTGRSCSLTARRAPCPIQGRRRGAVGRRDRSRPSSSARAARRSLVGTTTRSR